MRVPIEIVDAMRKVASEKHVFLGQVSEEVLLAYLEKNRHLLQK
jgi:hypothetical protein